MSAIAKMVREMIGKGVDPDVIELAVATAETVGLRNSAEFHTDHAAERRRAKDRDRKRMAKEQSGNSADSAEIPQNSKTPLTILPSSNTELVVREGKKVRARKAQKFPLSAEFQPKQSHFDAAERLGIPRQAVLDKCEDMRLWAASSGEFKADWDATLHGFMRRDADKIKQAKGKLTVHDAARNQTGRAMEFLHGLDQPAPSDIRDATGRSSVRLLSSG